MPAWWPTGPRGTGGSTRSIRRDSIPSVSSSTDSGHRLSPPSRRGRRKPSKGGRMATIAPTTDTPVLKNITVKADPEHAFRVFTEDIDSWWPREYHIGKAPLKKMILEGKPGGRCY